jgi:hypothetical protein
VRSVLFLCLVSFSGFAQSFSAEKTWVDQLKLSAGLPEKLLSTRSAVFHDYTFTPKELKEAQEYFQRTGIDAITYFELDMLMASVDITKAFADYLTKREVTHILFLEKNETGYRLSITTFNDKSTVVDANQNAWSISNRVWTEVLKSLYRSAANQLKKQNLLINDFPEEDIVINPIVGRRNEFFGVDMKVDPVAIPKFGNEAMDKQLEEIFKNNYPLKYKVTEPGLSEKDLRKQGYLYVMCVVHARGAVAKKLLGYDMTKSESALVSVTYSNGQSQLKNFPSNEPVYKIYFKHIESGNVFLGNKWDADLTWEQALLNHLKGMKTELRIN